MLAVMNPGRKLLVVDTAALGWDLVHDAGVTDLAGRTIQPLETVFPALTLPVQASFRTGVPPAAHGVPGNGFYDRRLARTFFWEQSASLIRGRRIWDDLRAAGGRAGLLFWQGSLGEEADVILTPKPVHKHHGGMIQHCYSRPEALYHHLCDAVGGAFNLGWYWGPLASGRASAWIADATAHLMARPEAPEVLLTYLPHLDYGLQRSGPDSQIAREAVREIFAVLQRLLRAAEAQGYAWAVFGDYAIAPVTLPPCFPNRILREAGLLQVNRVGRMAYPDFHASGALAVADHEIAFIHARGPGETAAARRALEACPLVAEVLDVPAQKACGAGGFEGGPDLLAVAAEGSWMAYPWWTDAREAPDYAAHVDIHNKPGYDPCELFMGFPPFRVSANPLRVRGTHGRAGAKRRVAWATSCEGLPSVAGVTDLAPALLHWLSGRN